MEQINTNIVVCLSSDDNYSPFVATTAYSLLSKTHSFIEIYVLSLGISILNQEKIKKSLSSFENFSVTFVPINSEELGDLPERPNLSRAMYLRYCIPDILPDNVKKAIYTDVDVIFVGDIAELWNETLDEYPIAAVPSQRIYTCNSYKREKKRLRLSEDHDFFMSGLLVIDCLQWKKNNYLSKLLSKTLEMADTLHLPDQEVMNIVFDNNYKRLSPKYCIIGKLQFSDYSHKKLENIYDSKVIVHFPGEKPWTNKNVPFSYLFWSVAEQTAFFEDIKLLSVNFDNCFSHFDRCKDFLSNLRTLGQISKSFKGDSFFEFYSYFFYKFINTKNKIIDFDFDSAIYIGNPFLQYKIKSERFKYFLSKDQYYDVVCSKASFSKYIHSVFKLPIKTIFLDLASMREISIKEILEAVLSPNFSRLYLYIFLRDRFCLDTSYQTDYISLSAIFEILQRQCKSFETEWLQNFGNFRCVQYMLFNMKCPYSDDETAESKFINDDLYPIFKGLKISMAKR